MTWQVFPAVFTSGAVEQLYWHAQQTIHRLFRSLLLEVKSNQMKFYWTVQFCVQHMVSAQTVCILEKKQHFHFFYTFIFALKLVDKALSRYQDLHGRFFSSFHSYQWIKMDFGMFCWVFLRTSWFSFPMETPPLSSVRCFHILRLSASAAGISWTPLCRAHLVSLSAAAPLAFTRSLSFSFCSCCWASACACVSVSVWGFIHLVLRWFCWAEPVCISILRDGK